MSNSHIKQDPYEQIVTRNRYGIRSLQAKYLQNQYDRMTAAKNAQKMQQKQQKDHELQMLNQLNQTYLNQMHDHRKKKLNEQKSLSVQYQEFIRNRDNKGKYDKHAEKNLQKSTLVAPTWIRDVFAQRQTYRKNMDHYSQALADHVKLQQVRKEAEREEEMIRKKKIDLEAQQLLKKERAQLEARHRHKSLFQKRQNDLLGVKSNYNEGIGKNGLIPQDTIMRRREQDLYSQGLELQLKKEQEKRHSATQDKMSTVNVNVYNPITNPLPFVYKNPNVLRMMAHN